MNVSVNQNEVMFRLMSMRIMILTLLLITAGSISSIEAQISESQARELLAERNIPEDTLRARLLKKGYDIDNLTPSQVQSFQAVLIETINEIENTAQSPAQPPTNVPAPKPENQVQQKPEETVVAKTEAPPTPTAKENKGRIYGQDIFRNNTIAVYKTSNETIVPEDYIMDTGDQISVVGFGRSQFDHLLTITNEGFVQPGDRLPKILLKGLKWSEAKEVLYQRYSQYNVISRGEFVATLNKPRNMTVNVFGEAMTTGAITLPGVNNAFNVISAAGGPTDIGSVRRIKIIRGDKSIPVDVYQFMNDPAVATNYYLRNNDYIHIPVAQKVVTINGAIIRPYVYELLDNENLVELIKFAGGTRADAYLSDVQITRYLEDRKIITNVNLRELTQHGGDYILINGDVIDIKSVEDATENYVTIQGAVTFPGKYENRPGYRISDLAHQAVLKPDARLDFAYLLRYQPDGTYRYQRINLRQILDNPQSPENTVLGNRDLLDVMTLRLYANAGFFVVQGAVKRPDTFAFSPQGNLRVEDAILLAGGLEQEAAGQGYIIRHDPKEPRIVQYIPIDFEEALETPGSNQNTDILSGDVIRVFNKLDQRDDIYVSISGSVRKPGLYPYGPQMRLADLVALAGGFTFDADRNRIDVARADLVSGQQLKITQTTTQLTEGDDSSILLIPYDEVYVRSIPEFEMQQTVRIEGEVRYPGAYALVKDKERIYDLIERSGGLTGEAFPEGAKMYRKVDSTGLVVIDLKSILQNKSSPSNIVLVAGDVIQIPKSKDLVSIEGFVNLDEVYSPIFLRGENMISVAFRGERSAKFYVDYFAAGVSKDGAPSEIKVQYADGRVEKTKKVLFFNSYPKVKRGSHIIVGQKIQKPVTPKEESKTDWAGVLKDTMAQATAVLTLLILVDQLSK